jgi:AcrR family transcriptional regulator
MYKQCGMTRANEQDRVRRQVVDAILATQLDRSDAHDGASSRVRLILTGERLIATYGLDAVSLRQVAAEAGAANTSAVQYHFGSKEGLVEAIMAYRHRVMHGTIQGLVEPAAPA